MEAIHLREDMWQRKYSRVNERRKQLEALVVEQAQTATQASAMRGPDMEEGPYAALTEEQWFDALETGLDAGETSQGGLVPQLRLQPCCKPRG